MADLRETALRFAAKQDERTHAIVLGLTNIADEIADATEHVRDCIARERVESPNGVRAVTPLAGVSEAATVAWVPAAEFAALANVAAAARDLHFHAGNFPVYSGKNLDELFTVLGDYLAALDEVRGERNVGASE